MPPKIRPPVYKTDKKALIAQSFGYSSRFNSRRLEGETHALWIHIFIVLCSYTHRLIFSFASPLWIPSYLKKKLAAGEDKALGKLQKVYSDYSNDEQT